MALQRPLVKNQLGHSSITLTSNTYGQVLEQRQREAARVVTRCWAGRVRAIHTTAPGLPEWHADLR